MRRAWAPTWRSRSRRRVLLRDEGGDGIEDNDVDGIRTHKGLDDAEGLLTGAGRRGGVVEIDAEAGAYWGIEGVLDIDRRRRAALLLGLGDHRQGDPSFSPEDSGP